MFRFASPEFLFLLAVIPLALLLRRGRAAEPAMTLPGVPGEPAPARTTAASLEPLVRAMKPLALALAIVALAGPQWGDKRDLVKTEGINIILAVDVSESMSAMDFVRDGQRVNRLEAVKGVVRDFAAGRRGDRIGVVVFGSQAYTQLPLTQDPEAVVRAIDALEIGAAGKRTAVGDALGIALKRLEDVKSASNVVVLLTDGRSNTGRLTPQEAARVAAERGVKVYTIGVGGDEPAPFLIQDPLFGQRVVYQRVERDEATLKELARATNGRFFRAEDLGDLRNVYETIDKLEKSEAEVEVFANYTDLYPWLLFPAFCLLLGWIVLSQTRFLEVP